MKTFKCKECGKLLGEMQKGRLLKSAVIYCDECNRNKETLIMAAKLSFKSKNTSKDNILNNIFKGIY